MIRVVADTNIFISALVFGGLPGAFLNLALEGSFALITSPVILDELIDKLCSKFEVTSTDAKLIRAKLEYVSNLVDTTMTRMMTAFSNAPSLAMQIVLSAETVIC